MSAEIGAALAIHWWKAAITVVLGYFGFRFQQNYSEKERRLKTLEEQQISMNNKFIEQTSKVATLEKNLEDLLKHIKSTSEKSDRNMELVKEDVGKISTSIAVIQNDVKHIKEEK